MNLLHLKYAVEIEKTRSMNKAAENLFMGQPNLSRAIKELEESLGITIFKRTSKGMTPTAKGEEFLSYAKNILVQIETLESLYKDDNENKIRFSISVPRASYISHAFINFAKQLDDDKNTEIYYKETNSVQAIDNIIQEDYHLAIVRYQSAFESYFNIMFNEKNLHAQELWEFEYAAVMSCRHRLADRDSIMCSDLNDSIQILHGDPYVPLMNASEIKKAELNGSAEKKIFLFERASQFELLESIDNSYMWVSPIPKEILVKYNLVQKRCSDFKRKYKDVIVCRKDYNFNRYDRLFINLVEKAKNEVENF